MSLLKLIIPLFIILGILQAAVLALPFLYWRFQGYMGPINKFLFGSLLVFVAFVLHPLMVIGLITFTIAPTLLSLRHNLASRAGTIYTALVPQTLPSMPLLDKGLPDTSREWLMALLSGYTGWKVLGTVPSLMVLLVIVALFAGRERPEEDRGWIADKWLRGERNEEAEKVKETGLSVRRRKRSARTDVQVVD